MSQLMKLIAAYFREQRIYESLDFDRVIRKMRTQRNPDFLRITHYSSQNPNYAPHKSEASIPAMELLQCLISPLATAAALLLAFVLLLFRLRRRGEQPPIAGSVFHQLFFFPTVHDYNTRIFSKHRTIRIYSPLDRTFSTVDPANVEHILKTNFTNYGKGNYNYEKMEDLLGDGIFAVDGEKWRHQRKLASYDFSTRTLRDFSSDVFKANASKLANIISQMPSQPFDLQDLFLKSAMDSIFKVGFGVELESLSGSNETGVAFARAFDDSSVLISMRYLDPLWKVKKLLNIGLERPHKKNLRLIDDFVNDIIRSKMDNDSPDQKDKKMDMLSRFMEESTRDPKRMTQKYLRDIILNFLIAGKDTTAGTLAWFFCMMCKHPSIQEKVVRDINEAMGTVSNSSNSFEEFASSMTEEALERMQYLHAALSETLRLYPAVPIDPKVCFGDDTLPDGYKVRKGDIVGYMPYCMGRMRFLWGEDAELFRPERWLDEEGRFQPESPFKFTAFQAGPRICLGKEFAYRQMKIFAAVLLRFFSFRLGDENKVVRYRTMLTLHVDGGLHVCSSPR